MTRHRIVTWPWLRRLGRLVLPDWLAITIGRTVFAWRALTDDELEHELEHVRQWGRMGWRYPIAYLAASLQARRARRAVVPRQPVRGGGPRRGVAHPRG